MEKLKIFDSLVEAEQTIPENKMVLLKTASKKICLARTTKGIFAVDNACPHYEASLSDGTVNYLGEVVCPWHSYRYDLETGKECKHRSAEVKTYPIEILDEGVFITLID